LIADAEKISITDDALRDIARAGEGSMRDAQSAFDQVISFSGDKIKAEDVEAALGIAGVEVLARVVNGIAEGNAREALAVVDDLVMRGHDLRNFCRDLLAHLRDLLVVKVSGETAEFLESNASGGKELKRQAAAFTESDLIRFFHSLTETENSLRTAAHPRYQLEVGLFKLMEMRRLAPLKQIIERLDALEESARTGTAPALKRTPPTAASGSSNPAGAGGKQPKISGASGSRAGGAVSQTVEKDEPPRASLPAEEPPFSGVGGTPSSAAAPVLTLVPPAVTPSENENAVPPPSTVQPTPASVEAAEAAPAPAATGSIIESIKAALEKRRRMFLVTALDGARKASVEGDELAIVFAPEAKHLRDTLAKPDSVKILREVCRELLGRDMGVRISVRERADSGGGEGGGAATSKEEEERREQQRLREYAEQHPAVQQLLQTFHGEIVDVRRVEREPGDMS
ncbi:MAG: hypothetical protein H7Y30_02790, partial [Pyrinomonadaceae bacterium]|nr:hypothetical protein [Pyrinomonadaceae bacterium]